MSAMFSYQFYRRTPEGVEPLPEVRQVTASSRDEAAQMILGEPVATAGTIASVAVKVWPTGKAKVSDDVRHYWVAGRS